MKKLIMSLAFAFFGLTAVNAQTGTHDQDRPQQEQQRGGQEQEDGMFDQDDQDMNEQEGIQQNQQLEGEDGATYDVAEKSRISIVELPEEVVNELQSDEFRDMQILEVYELELQDEDEEQAYEIHLMDDDQRKVKYFDSEGNKLKTGNGDGAESDSDDENSLEDDEMEDDNNDGIHNK
jgi:hypothetical protein